MMKMLDRRLRANGDPEGQHGAVLLIVAISLLVLLGMLVLTVDLGLLVARKRVMVQAADAAALAAAQSCVTGSGVPATVADDYAAQNGNEIAVNGGIIDQQNCLPSAGSGYVTVQYTMTQDLLFARVLGFTSSDVVARATARWGPTGVAGPIPLVINVGSLQGPCEVPFVDPGGVCYFWFDNDLLSGSNFGFLDVEEYPAGGWNVPSMTAANVCNSSGGANQLMNWVLGNDPVQPLSLNYPNATWVCSRSGLAGNPAQGAAVWGAIDQLVGEERDFPISGPTDDGFPAQYDGPGGTKYNIVGFARLEILEVVDAQNAALTCRVEGTSSPVDLLAEGAVSCGIPAGAFFGEVTQVNPSGSVQWDVTSDGLFTWTRSGGGQNPSVSVTFEYFTADSGLCGGTPPPNASARCIVVRWNGSTLTDTPGEGGEGQDFGIRRIWLSA